jgi:hypothetical protein
MADTPAHPAHGGTVNILGHPVKKQTALIAGAAGVVVIIVAVERKRAAAAAGASPAALVSDPAGNQCSALNPATGYCPGTAADTAAQQATADGLSSASTDDLAGGSSGGGYYYTPPVTGTGTSGTGSAVPAFTDNASWGQYVETALGSNGSDAVAAAIAKYLSGQPVTEAQQTTIEEAIAIANYPPVTGPNGDPPSMTLLSSSTGTSSSGTSSSGTSSSGTSSSGTSSAGTSSSVSGGHVVSVTSTGAVIAWTPHGPAKSWKVTRVGSPPTGGPVTDTVGIPQATYRGLNAGHNYEVTVQPLPSGQSGVIHFLTKG